MFNFTQQVQPSPYPLQSYNNPYYAITCEPSYHQCCCHQVSYSLSQQHIEAAPQQLTKNLTVAEALDMVLNVRCMIANFMTSGHSHHFHVQKATLRQSLRFDFRGV